MIRDPVLIKSGLGECRMLSEQFPYHSFIDLIVSSPLRRSLYTALEAFKPAIARGVKVVALPELQETSDIACDTGTEVSELAREFSVELGPSGPVVDLSLLKPGWWVKVRLSALMQIDYHFVFMTERHIDRTNHRKVNMRRHPAPLSREQKMRDNGCEQGQKKRS